MEMQAVQEREKMRDGDGETPWVMADSYCMRGISAIRSIHKGGVFCPSFIS
jgi:hypothetical protein